MFRLFLIKLTWGRGGGLVALGFLRSECEADHSPPCRSDINNAWSTSTAFFFNTNDAWMSHRVLTNYVVRSFTLFSCLTFGYKLVMHAKCSAASRNNDNASVARVFFCAETEF